MTMYSSAEARDEIYYQLNSKREIACDPGTGSLTREAAWEDINFLLDILNDLNCIEVVQVAEQ